MGLDQHGYPSEEDIERIKLWEFAQRGSFEQLMEFVKDCWNYSDWGFRQDGRKYWLSTGGWSGNEEVIEAMHENVGMFWSICWHVSKRGGHFEFEIPEDATYFIAVTPSSARREG